MTRPVFALGLLVAAALPSGRAGGDAAVPPPAKRSGAGRGGPERAAGAAPWIGRCAERLERARDEAARGKGALLAATVVEAVARERGAAGDPGASLTVDVVEARLELPGGLLYTATVEPDASPAAPGARDAWLEERYETAPSLPPVLLQRRRGGLVGTLMALPRRAPSWTLFATTFRRAVDDCLQAGVAGRK